MCCSDDGTDHGWDRASPSPNKYALRGAVRKVVHINTAIGAMKRLSGE